MAGSSFQPPINLDPRQDPSQQTAFINQNFQQLASSLNPFIVSDGTNNRIILGKQTDGTYGMKVSQTGVDVGIATNSQLIFNSNQDVFKIVQKIPTTIPSFVTTYSAGSNSTSGSRLLTVAHGQSFTPIVQVYVQGALLKFSDGTLITSSYVPLPVYGNNNNINNYYFSNSGGGSFYFMDILYVADATNVYIQAAVALVGDSHDTIAAIPATIFVLQETAT